MKEGMKNEKSTGPSGIGDPRGEMQGRDYL